MNQGKPISKSYYQLIIIITIITITTIIMMMIKTITIIIIIIVYLTDPRGGSSLLNYIINRICNRNRRAITWVSNYGYPILTFCNSERNRVHRFKSALRFAFVRI